MWANDRNYLMLWLKSSWHFNQTLTYPQKCLGLIYFNSSDHSTDTLLDADILILSLTLTLTSKTYIYSNEVLTAMVGSDECGTLWWLALWHALFSCINYRYVIIFQKKKCIKLFAPMRSVKNSRQKNQVLYTTSCLTVYITSAQLHKGHFQQFCHRR
jgi:hypothetical protein